MKFSFSNKEDQSNNLGYFKDKLANMPSKSSKKSINKLSEKKEDDAFKNINFENFDSAEISSILKDNNKIDKKIFHQNKTNVKSNSNREFNKSKS
jgi:(p)ppGpp synthase/HD superfamily hydrolase